MVLQDEFPLAWSAFQSSPTNQVDRTEAPLSLLSTKMKRMFGEHPHKLESTSVGPRPSPPPSGYLDLHQEGLPQGSLLHHMLLAGMYLNVIGLGVPIPGLARNPHTNFRTGVGGVWPQWALPFHILPVGNTAFR